MKAVAMAAAAAVVVVSSGCATARYEVRPVGGQGAAVAVSFSQGATEHVANNWGKYLTAAGVAGLYFIGDNNGWFGGGGKHDDSQPSQQPASVGGDNQSISIGVSGNYAPVYIDVGTNGRDGLPLE